MSLDLVKDYYGRVLKTSADLKTDACRTLEAPPPHLRAALERVHDDVKARYYGCGLVAPEKLDGATVLDLGCGAGQDVYLLAQFVGPEGRVIGLDMTEGQLAVARDYERHHARAFGYRETNTSFRRGYIEDIAGAGIAPGSVDVIVSNCVLNLSPDKPRVLEQAFAALKPGGEFYFSDVYADRRTPPAWRDDQMLLGECLAGASYWNDFLSMAKAAGFADPRLVTSRPMHLHEAIRPKTGMIQFYSATYRLFKLDGLEPACEDYGQAVIYDGGILGSEGAFTLDGHHRIEAGKVFPVCGNTWRMLNETRFAPHFKFIGDFSRHFGIFPDCGTAIPFAQADAAPPGACC